ncbi:non-ribosomal peptide synthetase [Synechocystis sp. PCC 7509]|uniref:non-ribosomal peptide synthetase n=1 Tax=Synechocystis sp. PCC 7509 TaxID=927677 RepID=UPI0002ACB781|nr:non-ribosomal peptide synthetase [Synechocystis sp. PCC 7509]
MKTENIEDIYKLSPTQQGLLFHTLYAPDSGVYCDRYNITLKGLKVSAFKQAWQQVVQRHAVLRTSFFWEEVDEPIQVVHRQVTLPFTQHDWRGIDEQQQKLAAFLNAEQKRGFELATPPLMRLDVIQMTENVYQFVWINHHLLLDGWSRFVLFKEVLELYQALCNNQNLYLKPAFPYRKYIAWLRQQDLGQAETYWRQTLKGVTAPTPLVVDKFIVGSSSEFSDRLLELSPADTEQLKALAKQHQLTLNTLIQGAWALLLSRYSNENDVVFGANTSGRPANLLGVDAAIGLFVNTLPVRVKVNGRDRLIPWLKNLQAEQAQARQYEYSPLVQVQGWSEIPKGVPLFHSFIAFENYPVDASLRQSQGGLEIGAVDAINRNNYPLTLIVAPGEQLHLQTIYDRQYFDDEAISRLLGHLQTLLVGMVANPQQQLQDLPLLTQTERQSINKWNSTHTKYSFQCLHQLIEHQVEKTPNAIALVFNNQKLTYQQLNSRANQLAHYLQKLGVKPEIQVGICVERSLEMIVGILGILKAGGAYVPIDPEYPSQRQLFMLQDCKTTVLLTQEKFTATLSDSLQVICLDTDWEDFAQQPTYNLTTSVTPENLAYTIYTSGSTGKPKGAMNTHIAVCNRLLWMQETYQISAADRLIQKTPFSFDVSVWELFLPLLAGACLVIAQPGGHKDSNYLVNLIAQEQITTVHFVPSMLRIFLQEAELEKCISLRRVFCSGEALPFDLQQSFFQHLNAQLYNLYGPTEAAIDVTAWTCQNHSTEVVVPIGYAISNIQIYILNAEFNLVPVGVPGELYIGGVGLARGYCDFPDLTAEKFIPHPWSLKPGMRLYKTGDIARYHADGSIEYLGRSDNQVKLRGFRIELGEIEVALRQLSTVRETVVLLREDIPGEQRLVAYVVADEIGNFRQLLSDKLPEHTIPAVFVQLPAIPLTANGKIDRRGLPAPDAVRPELTKFVSARTPLEAKLAAIWAEVLHLEQVGIHDNFFELGGDSILSIQAIAKAKQTDIQLTPKLLFSHPTIAELATVATTTPTINAQQGLVTGSVPLTPIQHWFFEQEIIDPHHWNQAVLLQAKQKLEPELLAAAVKQLIHHHDALRLRFTPTTTGWQQVNAPPDEVVPFSHIDLSTLPESDRLLAMETKINQLQASIDLSQGSLLRVALFNLGREQPQRLLVIVHHLAIDGVSWRILLADLQTAYQQLALPPKTTSFQAWAYRLQEYARSQLFKPTIQQSTPLPVDYPNGTNTVASAQTINISLTTAETQALLQEVPKAYNTQINDVLLTALVQAFTQWTGESAVLIDLEGHGREMLFADVDISRTVGWFTSIFPVRLDLETLEPGAALKSIKEQLRQIPNNGIDYGVQRYLAKNLEIAVSPQISFNYLGQFDATRSQLSLFELALETEGITRSLQGKRSHLLTINGFVSEGKLQLSWTYSNAIHQASTIENLAQGFLGRLRSLIVHCQSPTTGGYTPSDFPLVKLNSATLDRLIGSNYRQIEDIYPLSPLQQGLLFHTLYAPESQMYVEQWSCSLQGKLNLPALKSAWQQVIERHSVLRTAFYWENLDEPVQVVRKQVELPWQQYDWRELSPTQQNQQLEQFLASCQLQLSSAPLMQIALIQVADDKSYFIWSHHHILMDGWAAALLLKEVFALYQAANRGEQLALAPACSYRNYINWLQQQNMQAAETFWRQALQGFTTTTPVFPQYQTSNPDNSYKLQEIQLSPTTSATLQALASQHQIALNALIQGTWALLLSYYSGELDVVFGATVSGRPATLAGAESLVGLFINTLPVRVRIVPDALLWSWLHQLHSLQAEARQYEHSPLAAIHKWSELPQHLPLFESIVVFQNYPVAPALERESTDLQLTDVRAAVSRNNYPLTLRVRANTAWVMQLLYNCDRFESATITKIFHQLETLLNQIVTQSNSKLSDLLATLAAVEKSQNQQLSTASLEKLKTAKRKAISK